MATSVHLLHIPKTGGITFHRALQQAGLEATRSHDPAAVPDGALVVTLLRNPIDRAWSVYRYQKRQGQFDGPLSAFLQQTFDPWWWGVRNIQARYMRPGVLVGTTETLHQTLTRVCAICGVSVPEYEVHGKDDGPGYSLQDSVQLTYAVGRDDRALYEIVERSY